MTRASRSRTALAATIAAALLMAPGAHTFAQQVSQQPDSALASLAKEFVIATLAFSPSAAVAAGLHTFKDPRTGATVSLDTLLDDFSPAEMARQRRYITSVQQRLAAIPRARLD